MTFDSMNANPELRAYLVIFAENGVRYQATLTFLNGALHSLMTAITGS